MFNLKKDPRSSKDPRDRKNFISNQKLEKITDSSLKDSIEETLKKLDAATTASLKF